MFRFAYQGSSDQDPIYISWAVFLEETGQFVGCIGENITNNTFTIEKKLILPNDFVWRSGFLRREEHYKTKDDAACVLFAEKV